MSTNWQYITKDSDPNEPLVKELFNEALSVAPQGVVNVDKYGQLINEDTVAMLPREPIHGRCHLCGKEADLTREHIPPFSSGNKYRHEILTFDDWLTDRLNMHSATKHSIEQGGIFGYTLCQSCNSLTGYLYGNEYKRWVQIATKIIDGYGSNVILQMNTIPKTAGDEVTFGSEAGGGVKPGSFVRQVLSCMCSISGAWNLTDRYPEMRRIILEQSAESLPSGMELGMSFYFGPRIRVFGPQLIISPKTSTWRWCQEIAFSPFSFILVLASNLKESGLGLLIDNLTTLSPKEEQVFSGIVELGFGWTPYLGDYRSGSKIIADRQQPL